MGRSIFRPEKQLERGVPTRACFARWRKSKASWVKQEERRKRGQSSDGDPAGIGLRASPRDLAFTVQEMGSHVTVLSRDKIRGVL